MHQALTTDAATVAAAPSSRKKRWSRKKRYIIFGSIGLLLLWIISSIISSKREKPIPITTEKAVRKTIVQTVSATGKVQPEIEVKISPEVAGEIIELPVEDGMPIKKGDLLVRIKPEFYKAQLDQQEAAISSAKAITLQQKASMTKAEQDLKRSQDLFSKKMIAESDFTAAQAAYDMAKNTHESSLHQIEQAQAGSSQARDLLFKTTIYSPLEGTVTVLNSKLGDKTDIKIDAYGDRKFKGTVQQIANTGKTTGAGTQEEVTNFEVKLSIDEHDVSLRPGLSCTADIETNVVKNVVAVPMQSVTIRTGDSNLSPEEIEKRKQKAAARDKGDNDAEVTNNRQEKQEQKEEREKLAKVVFLKSGSKAHMVKVTTGIADDSYMEIKSGIKAGDEVISGSYSAISRKLKDGAKVTYDKEATK